MYSDIVIVEFVGGSRDGEVIRANGAPEYLEVKPKNGWIEIYERQNEEPPFIYVQVGYSQEEQWK